MKNSILLALLAPLLVVGCSVKAPDVNVAGDVKVQHEISLGKSETVEQLTTLFNDVFGRDPSATESTYWSDLVDKGMSISYVKDALEAFKKFIGDGDTTGAK